MNQRKKWMGRHGIVVRRKTREMGPTSLAGTPPWWHRNLLNRRIRREDKVLLRNGWWENFRNRLTRDASWYW